MWSDPTALQVAEIFGGLLAFLLIASLIVRRFVIKPLHLARVDAVREQEESWRDKAMVARAEAEEFAEQLDQSNELRRKALDEAIDADRVAKDAVAAAERRVEEVEEEAAQQSNKERVERQRLTNQQKELEDQRSVGVCATRQVMREIYQSVHSDLVAALAGVEGRARDAGLVLVRVGAGSEESVSSKQPVKIKPQMHKAGGFPKALEWARKNAREMNSNTVTQEHVDAIVKGSKFEGQKIGAKTTVVIATLPNGFEIVESSACVDATNYSHNLGVEICKKRITERIWALEGYALQDSLAAK